MTMANVASSPLPRVVSPRTPRFASAGWFVVCVIAGGFLSFLQDRFLGRFLPVEAVLRLALLLQIAFVFQFGRLRPRPLPGYVTLALGCFGISMVATLLLSLLAGTAPAQVLRSFYFMFNVGFFLLFFPLVPLQFGAGGLLRLYLALSFGFGALQVLAQDLFLSNALRFEFGLAFDRFINGDIRAVSFFSSAARFAECIALVSCYALYHLLTRVRHWLFFTAVYLMAIWLMVNTYSRSGYILMAVSNLLVLILTNRELVGARRVARYLVLFGVFTAGLVTLIVASFTSVAEKLSINDLASLLARLDHWREITDSFTGNSWSQMIFGGGIAALYSRSSLEYFVVDNIILAVLSYGGLLGLVAFLFVFVAIARIGLKTAVTSSAPNLKPLLAFYFALLVAGQFLDNHNTLFLTQFGILALVSSARLNSVSAPQ